MFVDHHLRGPQPSSPIEVRLNNLDQRMGKQNRSMRANLMAWAEVLDALGWSVALQLPGEPPVLSHSAREWLRAHTGEPMTWETITCLLAAMPPTNLLICTNQLQVWSESVANTPPVTGHSPSPSLTKRESEVLDWLREGKTGPEIAIILGCAQRTVESHIANVYRKLGVHDRSQLLFQTAPVIS